MLGTSSLTQLLDYASWEVARPGDSEWQRTVVEQLRERASAEHIELMTNEIGCVRYRPEEVAAAATVAPPPASFSVCSEQGKRILDRLTTSESS